MGEYDEPTFGACAYRLELREAFGYEAWNSSSLNGSYKIGVISNSRGAITRT